MVTGQSKCTIESSVFPEFIRNREKFIGSTGPDAAVAQGQSTSLVRTGSEVRFLSAAPSSASIGAPDGTPFKSMGYFSFSLCFFSILDLFNIVDFIHKFDTYL